MSLISGHLPPVGNNTEFQQVNAKYGYRVCRELVDNCPNGVTGCKICQGVGRRSGYHYRPMATEVMNYTSVGREDGKLEVLRNRFLLTPLVITNASGTALVEGVDYTRDARDITFLASQNAPQRREVFSISYTAYAEDWVHIQHANVDFAGGGKKAESALPLQFASLEQGMIAMSIPSTARGYISKVGDRFHPVDAIMKFTQTLEAKRPNPVSRHAFVTKIIKAYGLDQNDTEVDCTCTWNPVNRKFTVVPPAGKAMPEKVVIIYYASPVYVMWLDSGEFRNPMAQDHQRLVLLVRDEINQ